MSYLQEKRKEFREVSARGDAKATEDWVMNEFLNSYHNGQKSPKLPKQETAKV